MASTIITTAQQADAGLLGMTPDHPIHLKLATNVTTRWMSCNPICENCNAYLNAHCKLAISCRTLSHLACVFKIVQTGNNK